LGASSMFAWQFAKLQRAAELNRWTRFAAMQDQYNLIKREEEREMLPMCLDMGVGCVPYSPQGKGRLTRPWGEQTQRSSVDVVAKSFDTDSDRPVVDAVQKVGNGHPGTAMSLAPAAYLLFQKVMRHNPADPHWPGRDRFVLSCGHSSLTLYIQLYLGGWGLELEDLKALADLERVRLLFDDLETRRDVIDLLGRAEQAEGVRIFIGSENKLFSLSGSSTIVAPYRDGKGRIVGVIGVIGPTRLNYARVIPMVDYTARVVSRLLAP